MWRLISSHRSHSSVTLDARFAARWAELCVMDSGCPFLQIALWQLERTPTHPPQSQKALSLKIDSALDGFRMFVCFRLTSLQLTSKTNTLKVTKKQKDDMLNCTAAHNMTSLNATEMLKGFQS